MLLMCEATETARSAAQRRREPRIRPSQRLNVEILGQNSTTVTGRILDISANGLSALVYQPVAPGSAVKIEAEEELLLAEVCYCRAQDGGYRAGLVVKHRLGGHSACIR